MKYRKYSKSYFKFSLDMKMRNWKESNKEIEYEDSQQNYS